MVNQVPRVDWSEIGGQEEAKLRLRQCVEWPLKYASTLRRFNVPPARGVLLYGPPGCSKTTLGEPLPHIPPNHHNTERRPSFDFLPFLHLPTSPSCRISQSCCIIPIPFRWRCILLLCW